MVLCVVTHSLIFAFSSVDRSAQFLCFFRQPLPSLPDAPFEQVNPFVAYPRHTLDSGNMSVIFIHSALSSLTPLTFVKKPLACTRPLVRQSTYF